MRERQDNLSREVQRVLTTLAALLTALSTTILAVVALVGS